jgi:hypothetical protein
LAEYRRDARGSEYQVAERAKRAEWLASIKEKGCSQCGEKHLGCLDFHHTDESTKKITIGTGLHHYGKKTIEAEVAKTIVLCSNCHRKLHYDENTGPYINKGKKFPGSRPMNTHEARKRRTSTSTG